MSQEFLSQILKNENSVISDDSENCPICLEEYGSISETGTIDHGVLLPCNHVVGSACIALWVNANNNCPLCRHIFFPRQPRSYLEDGIMQDSEDDGNGWSDRDAEEDEDGGRGEEDNEEEDDFDLYPWRYLTLWINELNFSLEVSHLSEIIIFHVIFQELATNSGVVSAAASLYVASHLWRQPLSLEEISRVAGIGRGAIQNAYRRLHADWFHFIDDEWPEIFDIPTRGQTAEAVRSIPWPSLEYEVLDDGEMGEDDGSREHSGDNITTGNRATNSSRGGGLGKVKVLCGEFTFDVNRSITANSDIWTMASKIADKTYSMSLHGGNDNPWTVAAACTHMASQLVGDLRPLEELAIVSGVPASWISEYYATMDGLREQIIEEDWVGEVIRQPL